MIAAGDLDDLGTRRLELALPAFRAWPVPDPDRDDWSAWESLLGSTRAPPGEPADRGDALPVGRVWDGIERSDRPSHARRAGPPADFPLRRMAARGHILAQYPFLSD